MPLKVALLPDGMDHLNIVGCARAKDDTGAAVLPRWLPRVALIEFLEGQKRVLALDGPKLKAVVVPPPRCWPEQGFR